jgi:protein-L-isoaspartate(D-aspartate) O-methyltransferase
MNKIIENDISKLILELTKNGINDLRVLKCIEEIPRSIFIESSIKSKSNLNIALPIECGQTISQPLVVAFMSQSLNLNKKIRILEIGTGSGYQTSILSKLVRFVYTIERYETLKKIAERKFKDLGFKNIFCKHADGGLGWKDQAPFDRIIVTASAPEIPITLLKQLNNNGIMIIPIGEDNNDQILTLVRKNNEGYVFKSNLMKVRFVPLLEGKK